MFGSGKMLSLGQYISLSEKAPRPNAGKAFIDFFLGDESMKHARQSGRVRKPQRHLSFSS